MKSSKYIVKRERCRKITLLISIFIVLIILVYLYFTNRLYLLTYDNFDSFLIDLDSFEKWIMSASLLPFIFLNIFFTKVYNLLFPDNSDHILRNTETILDNQEKHEQSFKIIQSKIDDLFKSSNIDVFKLKKYLNLLEFDSRIDIVLRSIHVWYTEKKISGEEKELLDALAINIVKIIKLKSIEVGILNSSESKGEQQYLSEMLLEFKKGNGQEIKNIYYKVKKSSFPKLIIILKEAIELTESLLAIVETKELYEELISLELSPENLNNFARFLEKFNFIDEGINYYKHSIELQKKSIGHMSIRERSNYALTHNNLGNLFLQKKNFHLALECYDEALQIKRNLVEENPVKYSESLAKTLNGIGSLYSEKLEFKQSLNFYLEAYEIRKEIYYKNKTIDSLKLYEHSANNLGHLYFLQKEYDLALEKLNEALRNSRELYANDPNCYAGFLASTLNNLGNLHVNRIEHGQAYDYYIEAITIRRKLAQENPRFYRPHVSATLTGLGDLKYDMFEYNKAIEYYEESLDIMNDFSKENPDTYLPEVSIILGRLGSSFSKINNHKRSIKCYEESLKIDRNLSSDNPTLYLPKISTGYHNLAYQYNIIGEINKAFEKYNEAIEIKRELVKKDPKVYLSGLAVSLNSLAILLLNQGDFQESLIKHKEALKIRKELAQDAPLVFSQEVASTLGNISTVLYNSNNYNLSHKKHDEALMIFKESAKRNPKVYGIDYANFLIKGVDLFKKDKNDLVKARAILENFPNVVKAESLLVVINRLEK